VSDDKYGGARPPTFSQRYGYEDYPTAIQHEGLDDRIRTDLWNYILLTYLKPTSKPVALREIWAEFLESPINYYQQDKLLGDIERTVRIHEWNRVYDLIQYLIQNTPLDARFGDVSKDFNRILARNRAGWRIVEMHVVSITNESELQSITEAAATATTPTSNHIKNALSLLANRESPNYAKSIHESISAAEGAAQELAGIRKPLGAALDAVKKNSSDLHPALITGWKNLYGFTSDSGGIRHAAFDGAIQPTQEFAQYFLVTCSAFVNLVTSLKAQGSG
jgi:AbiJ N-terminal domain 4